MIQTTPNSTPRLGKFSQVKKLVLGTIVLSCLVLGVLTLSPLAVYINQTHFIDNNRLIFFVIRLAVYALIIFSVNRQLYKTKKEDLQQKANFMLIRVFCVYEIIFGWGLPLQLIEAIR